MIQAAAINISVADIEYQKPVNKPAQKYYTAQLDALSIKTGETEDLEMRLQGSVNRIPVNLRAVSGKILYALWKNQDAMLDMDVQAGDANAHFSGGISRPLQHFVLAGQLSLKAGGLDKIGALYAGSWPASAALQATGDVHYSDKILAFNNLQAQLGTQPLNGDAMLNSAMKSSCHCKQGPDLFSRERLSRRGFFQPAAVLKMVNEHRRGTRDWSMQIWQLLTLELWLQTFVDHPAGKV